MLGDPARAPADTIGTRTSPRRGPGWQGLIGSYLLVVFLLLTLNFFLPRALPGSPVAALSEPSSPTYVGEADTRVAVEDYYGLNEPLLAQYGDYLGGLLRGDLGTSIQYQAPVVELIGERLPWTLLLVGASLTLSTAIGTLAGIHSGWRRGRRADGALVAMFVAIDNLPAFFLGSGAAYVFAVKLGWLPLSGGRTPFSEGWSTLRQAGDIAQHLILPASVLALQTLTFQYLIMRASMVGELGSDHLLLGRAKGLAERTLKYRYAARNALLPSITLLGVQLGSAITVAIFVETVFAYPGLGRLMFESVGNRDYPVMQGCFLVLSLLVVTANLLTDLAYRRLDPRVGR